MIQYIIDRGVDLECKTEYGWRPIHFLCKYSTFEMIQYIIDRGVDLQCQTKNGLKVFDLINEENKLKILEYLNKIFCYFNNKI